MAGKEEKKKMKLETALEAINKGLDMVRGERQRYARRLGHEDADIVRDLDAIIADFEKPTAGLSEMVQDLKAAHIFLDNEEDGA